MASNNNPRQHDTQRNIEMSGAAPAPPMVVVYATFPTRDDALAVGRAMVEARVAGCVNVIPGMTSIYVWDGKTETADEAVLIAKLPAAGADAAIAFIAGRHRYDTPAVFALPVASALPAYLKWLAGGVDTP